MDKIGSPLIAKPGENVLYTAVRSITAAWARTTCGSLISLFQHKSRECKHRAGKVLIWGFPQLNYI